MCGVSPWASCSLPFLCFLSAAPELGCSQTKLSVYMECLEGVCHESVANCTNQESWLVGEKTLTLSCWLKEVEGPWDAESRGLTLGQRNRESCRQTDAGGGAVTSQNDQCRPRPC